MALNDDHGFPDTNNNPNPYQPPDDPLEDVYGDKPVKVTFYPLAPDPIAIKDAPPFFSKKRTRRFFMGGGNGVAICDFTPTKVGTKRKLGAF